MARIGERPDSRPQSNSTSETRKYWIAETTDPDVARALVLATAPGALVTLSQTLYRQTKEISLEPDTGASLWIATVPYAPQQTETGSMKWGFDTTGGTVNIKAALEHMESYPAGAEGHQGAIGVHGDEVDGTDIVIPALKLNVSYSWPKGIITLAQAKAYARNTGKVNSDTFMTFEAGEVLFLGATGSDGSDTPAEIAYQFACSENLQNKLIGGINVVEQKGWHVAWVEFKDGDVAGGKPIKPPKAIHVERVYEEVNLQALLGFG